MASLSKFDSIVIDGTTAGVLTNAEIGVAKYDALASKSLLRSAVNRQLLRVDALCSSSIDGRHVEYSDLAAFEVGVLNSPFSDDDSATLFKLANKMGLMDPTGVVICYRYMRAVEWVTANVSQGTNLTTGIFDVIRRLYNENEIASLFDIDGDTMVETASNDSIFLDNEERHANNDETSNDIDDIFMDAEVQKLVQEYMEFINSDMLTPAAQAEISHAQLQMLKLYKGNLDAYERVFSHVIFHKRGVLTNCTVPLAAGPARDIKSHVKTIVINMDNLASGEFTAEDARAAFRNSAYCTDVSSKIATICLNMLTMFWKEHQEQIPSPRSDSAVIALAKLFLEWPYLTVDVAAKKLGRSFSATNNAMRELMKFGYVAESGHLDKHRLFYAIELVEAFEKFMTKVVSDKALNRDDILDEILNNV